MTIVAILIGILSIILKAGLVLLLLCGICIELIRILRRA